MKDRKQPNDAKGAMKPAQQTGEEFGSVKSGQLNDRNRAERADLARGSETETREQASRRG